MTRLYKPFHLCDTEQMDTTQVGCIRFGPLMDDLSARPSDGPLPAVGPTVAAVPVSVLDGLREFFNLLDKTEVDAAGRDYHPIKLTSEHIHDYGRLCDALAKMRGAL